MLGTCLLQRCKGISWRGLCTGGMHNRVGAGGAANQIYAWNQITSALSKWLKQCWGRKRTSSGGDSGTHLMEKVTWKSIIETLGPSVHTPPLSLDPERWALGLHIHSARPCFLGHDGQSRGWKQHSRKASEPICLGPRAASLIMASQWLPGIYKGLTWFSSAHLKSTPETCL